MSQPFLLSLHGIQGYSIPRFRTKYEDPKTMTSITIYDGNDTIGGSKIYVEQNGEGVFLDFGTNFYTWV